jgi:arsenical pump membrane protein
MSNAASLFLPSSNLTNLIVLHGHSGSGTLFLAQMWPAAVAAVVVTTLVLCASFRRELGAAAPEGADPVRARLGIGAAAIAVSTAFVLVLGSPALPVLAVGVASVLAARVGRARVAAAVDLRVLLSLFLVAVALGAAGRWWGDPARPLDRFGRVGTAAAGAVAALCVNNLPAAVLLTPRTPAHPRALLLGLNLGPNLAVTGSLSALLWLRVARSLGAEPSARTYTRIGALLVPLSLAAAVAALWLVAPGRL